MRAFAGADGKSSARERQAGRARIRDRGAELVHRALPDYPALADREFWTWLAVVHGRAVLEARYGAPVHLDNFGIGAAIENWPYRLSLSGDIAFDANRSNPCELVGVGDVDLWRSHIIRQQYAGARSFVQALLEFQRERRVDISTIRGLAKRLRRSGLNVRFELMDLARARAFIEAEWRASAQR